MDNIIIRNSDNTETLIIPDLKGFKQSIIDGISNNLIERLGLTKELETKAKDNTDLQDGLTITETAKYLGVSKVTVHRLMKDGEITYFKIRRRSFITKDSIKNYIEKNTYSQSEV